jgi:hypothetical protein
MTTKNVKIALKPEIHLKQKNFLSSDLIFLGVFKVKKIHDLNSPCHMEPFNKKKKTVLVVKFLINEHFLSPNRNPMTSSLSSNQKKE